MSRLLSGMIVLLAWSVTLHAEESPGLRGVALVIGQSDYEHLSPLPNPANDAAAIETLLEDLGFDVTGVTDRDARKLRRDIERFVEDAEEADAAVIYYSGHGIEAGGDNWLVPVDADLTALENVEETLVPVSGLLSDLRSSVPLTIFLIDACRSNPFPPGTVAKRQGEELPVSSSGLGVPRGASAAEPASAGEIGTIIGFAAEPGQPALDGERGGNSPYAAAILRHLSAMAGNELGLVLRMVTEEVYLKTGARQRPWVNESLRKQLYFGEPGAPLEGETGAITGERRLLLLTVAGLPGPDRQQVEAVAKAEGVPMDTLYGILSAFEDADLPKSPAARETMLRAQAAKIKTIIAERKALATDDPELLRLTSAADTAISEGAIKSARAFLDDAKALVEKSSASIENTEALVKAKRAANAAILVRSAEAAQLAFDFDAAVTDYAAAFDWVKESDRALAAKYKTFQADALQDIGSYRGDNAAFASAIDAYGLALGFSDGDGAAGQRAKISNNMGNVHLRLGERNLETAPLKSAITLYREALAIGTGVERATTLSNLGIALHALAERENDTAQFAEAEAAFAEAIAGRDRAKDAKGWAIDTLNSANLDVTLGDRNGERQRFDVAMRKIEEALTVLDPVVDKVSWAQAKNNFAIAQRIVGANRRDVEMVRAALATYNEMLPAFDRKTFPIDWANTNGNIAIAYTTIGAMQGTLPEFEQALAYYQMAFEEITRERAPVFWARLNNSYGMTLAVIGQMKSDPAILGQSADAFRKALSVRRKEINAEQWADSQQQLASVLSALASNKTDVNLSDEAIAAYRAAREVFTREAFPGDFLSVSSGLAMALQGKGVLTQDVAVFREAEVIYKDVLAATDRKTSPRDWASATKDIATIQFMLGTTSRDKALVEQSIRNFDLALEEFAVSGTFMDRMLINAMRDNAKQALALFD